MTRSFSVYYDHSCPLCRREIAFYQRRKGASDIDWIDVSEPNNAPKGLSCSQAMARFHVRKLDGTIIDGGAAFAELWTQLPAFKWLGVVFTRPPFRQLINILYDLFLPIRPHVQRYVRRRSTD